MQQGWQRGIPPFAVQGPGGSGRRDLSLRWRGYRRRHCPLAAAV